MGSNHDAVAGPLLRGEVNSSSERGRRALYRRVLIALDAEQAFHSLLHQLGPCVWADHDASHSGRVEVEWDVRDYNRTRGPERYTRRVGISADDQPPLTLAFERGMLKRCEPRKSLVVQLDPRLSSYPNPARFNGINCTSD